MSLCRFDISTIHLDNKHPLECRRIVLSVGRKERDRLGSLYACTMMVMLKTSSFYYYYKQQPIVHMSAVMHSLCSLPHVQTFQTRWRDDIPLLTPLFFGVLKNATTRKQELRGFG